MTVFSGVVRRLGVTRVFALLAVASLAACGAPTQQSRFDPTTGVAPAVVSPEVVARYQSVQDADVVIPAVAAGYLTGQNPRTEVFYFGPDKPGSIVVDPYARVLYHIHEGGTATRYGIAVGREGYGFSGDAVIGRKQVWPSWTPTKNMIRREPDVYGPVAGGLPGGLDNPLGARALYLYRGGRDTFYRIHGTNNASTIGRATSAGCIRLFNQDIIDLFEKVPNGTRVHVRGAAESAIAEDPMVENAHGLMVPIASLPVDVQAQIAAGNIPWPKFVPTVGVTPEDSAATDPAADPSGVFQQIN
ncbi:L,D-transpeptidase [Defluviimonas sp. SAOS-178_SWC]|uniref:L,D-transpeptidase n=1 Tax=Defluviimonas sp. SAOS-178_SWC TaxID=3121287 RepID=UPI0032215F36